MDCALRTPAYHRLVLIECDSGTFSKIWAGRQDWVTVTQLGAIPVRCNMTITLIDGWQQSKKATK